MIGLISRIVLGIELAVLVLLAGVLAVITAFGAMGMNSPTAVLYFVAFSTVCLAFVATAAIVLHRIRGSETEGPAGLRAGMAFSGAVVATGLTIWGRLFLSDNERWAQGLDFIGLGCFLWVPLSHLAALAILDRADKRPQS